MNTNCTQKRTNKKLIRAKNKRKFAKNGTFFESRLDVVLIAMLLLCLLLNLLRLVLRWRWSDAAHRRCRC